LRTANRKQIVTGITVNEKVNVDRRLLKKTRAMLHDLQKNGLASAAQKHFEGSALNAQLKDLFLSRLRAYISFIGQVRGRQDTTYLKMKATFHQVNFADQ
jgi:RNA-directed DNA polymerase